MRLNNFERLLLKRGNIFQAMKVFRERTGMGLLETKKIIEKSGERMGLMKSELCLYCKGKGKDMRWNHDKFESK